MIMKKILTYILAAVLVFLLVGIALRVKSCFDQADKVTTTTTSPDPNFSDVQHSTYRPPSTPFEHQKAPAQLPSNVKESDVKEVIIVTKDVPTSDSTSRKDTTSVIITKNGDVYVGKQGGEVSKVEVITYKPAILQWGIFPALGVTAGQTISPAVTVSPLLILGKVKLPLLAADYDIGKKMPGLGIGTAYRVWKIDLGIIAHWNTKMERGVKFVVAYGI